MCCFCFFYLNVYLFISKGRVTNEKRKGGKQRGKRDTLYLQACSLKHSSYQYHTSQSQDTRVPTWSPLQDDNTNLNHILIHFIISALYQLFL